MVKPAAKSAVNSVVKLHGAITGCGYQQLGSDIFHDLSQPLSTLVCLLEVNLLLSRPAKQLRHDLQIALQQANSIVRFERALRELWEAGSEHQDQETLSLAVCLRGVVADLLPMAESARVKLVLASSADCVVKVQASRLRQALAHVIEFALASSGPGAEVKITADERDGTGQVAVVVSAGTLSACGTPGAKAVTGEKAPPSDGKRREWKGRLGLAIARRILEMAGGSLLAENSADGLRLELRLPSIRGERD